MEMNRGNAEHRYGRYRTKVYGVLSGELEPLGGRASPINYRAIERWRETWLPLSDPEDERPDWDWEALRNRYSGPKRLDVALWAGDDLCGMILGHVSNGRNHVSLEYIASWRARHPLRGRILQLADIAGTVFAHQIGGRAVRVVEPADGLIERYSTLGYRPIPGCVPICLEKGVGR